MRKLLLLIAFVVAMAMFASRTYAYTQVVDGIEWNYVLSAGNAYVSGPSYSAAIPVNTVGAITIPSSLGGCPVTRIEDLAFMSCYGLTSVTIPDSVTSIGNYAFSNCRGLTDIYYTGTQAEWEQITIGTDAIPAGATIHYNYTPAE